MDWNLKDLYKSPDSKKIGSDFTKLDSKSKKFNKKYRNRISNSSSPKLIFESLVEIEKIYEGLGKISSYASLLFAADTDNEKYSKFYQNVSERSSDIRKNLIFYFLSWNKISEKRAKEIYSNPILRKYSHLLKSERKYKNFMLTEPEEKILDKKSITSSKAFNRLFDQTLNNLKFEMKLKNKISVLTETEVLSLLYDKDRKIRKSAAKSLTIGLKSERKLLAFIFNQILTDSKITNEIRGHKTPMSARNLSNEISEKTVQALIDTCNKYNKVPIRYYKLKSKILKTAAVYQAKKKSKKSKPYIYKKPD